MLAELLAKTYLTRNFLDVIMIVLQKKNAEF